MNDNVDDGGKSKALLNEGSAESASEPVNVGLEDGSSQEAGERVQDSEIFWADAVETTIHQTHPRVPQLKTQFICKYRFENGRLYVKTVKYMMTTRGDNKYRANIDLYLHGLESAQEISPDAMAQDGQWHLYEREISVAYGPIGAWGMPNRMCIRVDYDGSNNDVEPHEGYSPDVYPASTPILQSPANGALVSQPFLVSGSNGLVGGEISVRFFKNLVPQIIGSGSVKNDGSWEVTAQLPANELLVSIFVQQKIGDQISRISNSVGIYRYRAPRITFPANGAVLLFDTALKLKGEGTYTKIIDVYTPFAGIHHGSGTAGMSQAWETNFNLENYPNGGLVEMHAAHRGMNDWSQLHTFTLLAVPSISLPASTTVTNQRGPISGIGVPGARVEVFKDLNLAIKIGQAEVQANRHWEIVTFDNVMPPGPFSIVARQTLSGVTTVISAPRGFKVRPAQLVNVKHEVLPDGSIRIFGTGYAGAMVVFTLPGSTVTPPPDAPVLENGDWSTTATSWPYGNYNLQIVQKVGDGASGWIYSLPCDLKVEKKLPNVTDLDYTRDYQPTFSGRGNAGATVWLWRIDADEAVAPHVLLTTDGPWKSQVPAPWGPTLNRQVRIKQSGFVDQENEWLVLDVNIPPLAPGLNDPVENGLSPQLSGTCWWDAVVTLWYSDEDFGHNANVSNGQWTFRRDKPFAEDEVHTVTVTQFAGGQKSPAATTTFSVARPMLQPEITDPVSGSDVGRDVTISGLNGMLGASLQLWDIQVGDRLGDPTILDQDGAWSIELRNLTFRPYVINAVQTLKNRPSLASELHALTVVVLPPQITQPTEMGRLPRCGKITGCGMPGATVQIFWVGASGPSLPDVEVGGDGHWEVEVELPVVGQKTIQALQIFRSENGSELTSEKTEPRAFDVVPAPPLIESPIEADHVGSSTVVSGFGVVGDTVTVTLNNAVAQAVHVHAIVRPDRTWSVTVDLSSFLGGHYVLEAVASLETFESFPATRPVVLGTFRPTLDEPAAGRWVSHPVVFAGQGRPGSGTVMSWYNPDVPWAELLPIADGRWRGEATKPLPQSGNWFQFWQILTGDPNGETVSARVDSERFEVEPARPALKGS